ALLLGGDDVHRHQHRRRRVDGHRGAHLVERDVLEEGLHVGQGVDGDADLADLAGAEHVVAVEAHLGGQVEGHREPGLAVGGGGAEGGVGGGGGGGAGGRGG